MQINSIKNYSTNFNGILRVNRGTKRSSEYIDIDTDHIKGLTPMQSKQDMKLAWYCTAIKRDNAKDLYVYTYSDYDTYKLEINNIRDAIAYARTAPDKIVALDCFLQEMRN